MWYMSEWGCMGSAEWGVGNCCDDCGYIVSIVVVEAC